MHVPKISLIILTLNGEDYLQACFRSIRKQAYPQKQIEIVVVDNGSTDNSVTIAKSFNAKIFINKDGDVYRNWAIALHKITGDFVYMIDQDIELRGKNFFQKMLRPLLENPEIISSFTRKYPKKGQTWINRFISHHPAQCDPLYEFLTPPIEKSFFKKMPHYTICKFVLGQVPPFGRQFYRVSYLKKTASWRQDRVFDHDLVIKAIKAGFYLFAYVPEAGLYHHHARSLRHLLYKRQRNLKMHYFPENSTTEYRWLNLQKKKDIMRMLIWLIYANLFFPALLRGILRSLKYKDPVLLMEPIVTIATTDVILWNFVKDKMGRKILYQAISALLHPRDQKEKGAFGL